MNVPRVVGVPVMEIGGDAERLRPGGSWPAEIDAVYGPTPPERKKFCRYDVPTVPSLQHVAGKVIVPLRVGVPPIASPQQPKVEGMDRPGGSLPATTLKTGRLHGDPHEPPVIAMFWP